MSDVCFQKYYEFASTVVWLSTGNDRSMARSRTAALMTSFVRADIVVNAYLACVQLHRGISYCGSSEHPSIVLALLS